MIPEEIQKLPQWTHSYSSDEPKRPAHTTYEPSKGLTFAEALSRKVNGASVGLYVTDKDPYILGDIDHIDNVHYPFEEMSITLSSLLTNYPTYAEVSPSGKGIRFIYKLVSPEEKKLVSGKNFLSIDSGRGAQINIGPPWMRMTGQECKFSSNRISTIQWDNLKDVFRISLQRDDNVTTPSVPKATLSEVSEHLMRIPLDQNPRIIRAFKNVFEEEYHHYTFWMKVLMALHNYAAATNQMVECLSLAIKWSSQDKIAYTGDEDVVKHWRSMSSEHREIVSYLTLFKLSYSSHLKWPVPRKIPAGKDPKTHPVKPMNSEVANLKAMFDFYNIIIYNDVGNPFIYYLTGDEDIISKYYASLGILFDKFVGPTDIQHLTSATLYWCQQMGWTGLGRTLLRDHLTTLTHNKVKLLDPVHYYFSTPFEKLPLAYQENASFYHKSTFEDLFECLEIEYLTQDKEKEEQLYRKYYRIWLYGLIRAMYYSDHNVINNCMLILTGKEQIRKTSHFRYMLPEWMRGRYVVFTTHGFSTEASMRDLSKISATARIVVWDEVEQYLDEKTESNLKKLIDNTPQTIIDKYETIPRTIYPVSIYGATSNQNEFKLGSKGSRRLFIIPVKWVNTDAMSNICWHKLIKDLHTEVQEALKRDEIPWLLEEDELVYQNNLHGLVRSKNSIDLILEETFDFDTPLNIKTMVLDGVGSVQCDSSGRLLTIKQIHETLGRYHSQAYSINRPALLHSLRRMCSKYTGTGSTDQYMVKPKGVIKKGEFIQGPHKRWVMPPLHDNITGGLFG